MAINAISGLTLNFRNTVDGAEKASAKDMLRMSTGLRINSAADDAAGLAISSRMNAQSRGMAMAIRNANDLLSMTQTAEGAAKDISNTLQRMRELSVQAANGTLTDSDRTNINLEVSQLKEHIDAVSKQTKFNNINLLDGSIKNTSFQIGGNTGDTLKLSMPALDTASLAQTPVTNKYKLTFTNLAAGQSVTVAGLSFKATSDTSATDVTAAFSNLAENATTGAGTTTGEYSGTFTGFSSGKAVSTTLELSTTASNMKGDVPKVAVTQIDAIVTNSYTLTFSELLTGQAVTVAGLTYTATSDSTAADVSTAFSNLTEGATSGSGSTGTYSGIFTGFGTSSASGRALGITSNTQNPTGIAPTVAVKQLTNPRTTNTYNIQLPALISGQSVTVAGLTYTATADLTAADTALAFSNLSEGAVNGNATGNYSGIFQGFNANLASGNSLLITSTPLNTNGTPPVLSSAVGSSPNLPNITTTQGSPIVSAVAGVQYEEDYFIPIAHGFPISGDTIEINGLTATFAYDFGPNSDLNGINDLADQIMSFPAGLSNGKVSYSGTFHGLYNTSYAPHYNSSNVIDGMTIKVTSSMSDNSVNSSTPISVSTNFPGGAIKTNTVQQILPVFYAPAQTEVSKVDFSSVGTLKKGQSISIAGLKLTATSDIICSQLPEQFYYANTPAYVSLGFSSFGTFSGALTGFTDANGLQGLPNVLAFESTTAGTNVPDIHVTTLGVIAAPAPTYSLVSSVTQTNATRPTIANGGSSTTTTATEPRVEKKASTAHDLPNNLNAITVETAQGASDAIQVIDTSIEAVSKFEAELGAVENRVESVINNLTTANTNLKTSLSRIDDADYAIETSNMARHQIISQAAMAMLAQANQSTSTVASLLKSVG